MADWDPDLYRRFEAERTRPAKDLLADVGAVSPHEIVDLGCGPGNSTELVATRFPDARLTGIDTSDAMLASARERLPRVRFVNADAASWVPDRPPDLIFANAVLQWVPDHPTLFRRLFGLLSPGGVLAVQMPDNLDEPSHRLMRQVADTGTWRDRIGRAGDARAGTVLSPPAYYDVLTPAAATVDVWRTTYHHPMPSAAAIVNWLLSTGLRPFIDPLSEEERSEFLRRYEDALAGAYPRRADGQLLFGFPRMFIVAQARSR